MRGLFKAINFQQKCRDNLYLLSGQSWERPMECLPAACCHGEAGFRVDAEAETTWAPCLPRRQQVKGAAYSQRERGNRAGQREQIGGVSHGRSAQTPPHSRHFWTRSPALHVAADIFRSAGGALQKCTSNPCPDFMAFSAAENRPAFQVGVEAENFPWPLNEEDIWGMAFQTAGKRQ